MTGNPYWQLLVIVNLDIFWGWGAEHGKKRRSDILQTRNTSECKQKKGWERRLNYFEKSNPTVLTIAQTEAQ